MGGKQYPIKPVYMLGYVIDDTGLYYIGNNIKKVATQSGTITDLKTITYNEIFTAKKATDWSLFVFVSSFLKLLLKHLF